MGVEPLKTVLSEGFTPSNFPNKTLDLRRDDEVPYCIVGERGKGRRRGRKSSEKEETEKRPFDERAQDMVS